MKIKLELTGLKEAQDKIARFKQATVDNIKAATAGLVDESGPYSMYERMMENMKAIVYDVYQPVIYERKGMFGGLAGAVKTEYDGFTARVYIDGDELADRPLYDGSPYFWRVLAGHSVYPYDYPKSGAAFMKPRDFFTPTVDATQRDVENGEFKQALIRAINAAKSV